jgi:hypothetical protein
MAILQNLSVFALRLLVPGGAAAKGVVASLIQRFTDHSQSLTAPLQRVNERAWKAFEIALGGDSLWDQCVLALAPAEDKAFREQVRAFLDVSPLTRASRAHAQLFRQALKEVREARKQGALTRGGLSAAGFAKQAGHFNRFSDPQDELDAEWTLVDRTAHELRQSYPSLCRIAMSRTTSGKKPSLWAVAVRYYFRRQVEEDQKLFQGLAFAKLEALQEVQEKAFTGLTEALSHHGHRLEQWPILTG